MSVNPSEIKAAWATLSPPSEARLSSFPLAISLADHRVRLALDEVGQRHLLVPAGDERVEGDKRLSSLNVSQTTLMFGAEETSFVDVHCREVELNAEFDDLIADVIASVELSATPANETIQAIGRWRRMFRAAASRGLTERERLALFAELSVLESLLESDCSVVIDDWTGPDRDRHDFELGHLCLEVKALGEDSEDVTIHGLEQMDTHDGRPLSLLLLTVVADDGGTTLCELVDRLRDRLGRDTGFDRKLSMVKWNDQDYMLQTQRYCVTLVSVVPVGPLTPRIVPSDLVSGKAPDGVTSLRYKIGIESLLSDATNTSLAFLARVIAT